MQIVTVIPARGGSKGILRKNIVDICGKPMIYYTIQAAIDSTQIDRIIVSTDDPEIAKISEEFKAEVFLRPKDLAEDNTSMVDVILNVIAKLEVDNTLPDMIMLLQPTSPLRKTIDIDNAIALFLEKSPDMVISVSEYEHSPFWGLQIRDTYLEPLFKDENEIPNRQQLEPIYYPNGAIFLFNPHMMLKKRTFYPEKSIPYIMPKERSIDIDDSIDLEFVKCLMNKGKTLK